MLGAFFVPGGAPLGGWTNYPPLSGLGEITGPGEGMGETMWLISISLFCLASLMGALNFIATVIDLRAPGMSLMRMPLTVWAWFVTAILGLLAFGVLLAAGILLLLDRSAGTSFFIPAGLVVTDTVQNHSGGLAAALAALILVFRPSRGVYRDFPGHGRGFACAVHFRAQADIRLQSDGGSHLRHWRFWDLWFGAITCSSAE